VILIPGERESTGMGERERIGLPVECRVRLKAPSQDPEIMT